jgi:hypothetical protein
MYEMLCLSYTDGQTNCSIQGMFQSSKLCQGITQWLHSAEMFAMNVCVRRKIVFCETKAFLLLLQRIDTKLFKKTQVLFWELRIISNYSEHKI